MRRDVQLSLRLEGEAEYGTRTELKNIDSFQIYRARHSC